MAKQLPLGLRFAFSGPTGRDVRLLLNIRDLSENALKKKLKRGSDYGKSFHGSGYELHSFPYGAVWES